MIGIWAHYIGMVNNPKFLDQVRAHFDKEDHLVVVSFLSKQIT